MIQRKFSFIWYSFFLSCLFLTNTVWAQGTAQVSGSGAANAAEKSAKGNDYRIGPGDVLLIEVAGEPDLKHKVKVLEQGTIRLRHIDRDLKVAGLNEHEAAALLRQEFLVILKEPQVTVFIEEYRAKMASIAGAVNKPLQMALTREIRVYDLISQAGGLSDKAGSVIQLIHTQEPEGVETIQVADLIRKPELNRVVRDGDFVNVPEAGIIYVSGNVNKPGAFPLKESLKLSQAVAMAGGAAPDSKKKEVVLQRADGPDQSASTKQIVNLFEIEKDPSKDILLKPYDVILVPESNRAKQTRSLVQAFAGGLASALGWGIFR